MKAIKYIFSAFCLLALSSCGMTNPWEDWSDEGTMDESTRIRPSEVKKMLCSKDGWKMNYGGTDFYIQFFEDNTCVTNSDENILRPEIETTYHLDYDGADKVILTFEGNSSFLYLEDEPETVFIITDFNDNVITAAGRSYSKNASMAPTTASEIQMNAQNKDAILAKVKALSNLGAGAIQTVDGQFLAYFTLSSDNNNNWSINLLDIVGGAPVYTSYPLTLNVDDDTYGIADAGDLEINGVKIGGIKYAYDGSTSPQMTDPNLKFGGNSAYKWWEVYYDGSWQTHKLILEDCCSELAELASGRHGDIEFDPRAPRNLVFCPPNDNSNYWWYVFFEIGVSCDNDKNVIYFNNDNGTSLPFGGYGNDVDHCKEYMMPVVNLVFSPNGHMVITKDGATYFIETSGKGWFKL